MEAPSRQTLCDVALVYGGQPQATQLRTPHCLEKATEQDCPVPGHVNGIAPTGCTPLKMNDNDPVAMAYIFVKVLISSLKQLLLSLAIPTYLHLTGTISITVHMAFTLMQEYFLVLFV
jgi:hypothetical protein